NRGSELSCDLRRSVESRGSLSPSTWSTSFSTTNSPVVLDPQCEVPEPVSLSRSSLVPQSSYGLSVAHADIGDDAFKQEGGLGLAALVQIAQDFLSFLSDRAEHGHLSCDGRAFGSERGCCQSFSDRLKCFHRTLHVLAKPLRPLQ